MSVVFFFYILPTHNACWFFFLVPFLLLVHTAVKFHLLSILMSFLCCRSDSVAQHSRWPTSISFFQVLNKWIIRFFFRLVIRTIFSVWLKIKSIRPKPKLRGYALLNCISAKFFWAHKMRSSKMKSKPK